VPPGPTPTPAAVAPAAAAVLAGAAQHGVEQHGVEQHGVGPRVVGQHVVGRPRGVGQRFGLPGPVLLPGFPRAPRVHVVGSLALQDRRLERRCFRLPLLPLLPFPDPPA
jgi:hypothetical protein